jgi:hypothetical protein
MSLDKKNNGNAFRMTFRTLNNETFDLMDKQVAGSAVHVLYVEQPDLSLLNQSTL